MEVMDRPRCISTGHTVASQVADWMEREARLLALIKALEHDLKAVTDPELRLQVEARLLDWRATAATYRNQIGHYLGHDDRP